MFYNLEAGEEVPEMTKEKNHRFKNMNLTNLSLSGETG